MFIRKLEYSIDTGPVNFFFSKVVSHSFSNDTLANLSWMTYLHVAVMIEPALATLRYLFILFPMHIYRMLWLSNAENLCFLFPKEMSK
jgi:hypothetical protein